MRTKPLKSHQQHNKLSFLEQELLQSGVSLLAGVDEVGRGCLAGPVVAACVIYPNDAAACFPLVNDSKKISPKKREDLFTQIDETARAWGVARVEAPQIDQLNIHRASLLAMKLAVNNLAVMPDYLLVDGRFLVDLPLRQKAIVHGDGMCQVIGAASIMAKVFRDRLMTQFHQEYVNFSFDQHKGYGTKKHLEELKRYGPMHLHRRSFKGCT
jgi:ribonuclease HII